MTNTGQLTKDGIRLYQEADFAGMHTAGRLTAQILDDIAELVVPGATTGSIDDAIRILDVWHVGQA